MTKKGILFKRLEAPEHADSFSVRLWVRADSGEPRKEDWVPERSDGLEGWAASTGLSHPPRRGEEDSLFVMAGLVPAIHVFLVFLA